MVGRVLRIQPHWHLHAAPFYLFFPLEQEALAALEAVPLERLMAAAAAVRDTAYRHVTFSPKVFIPLTRLCRDRCALLPAAQQ